MGGAHVFGAPCQKSGSEQHALCVFGDLFSESDLFVARRDIEVTGSDDTVPLSAAGFADWLLGVALAMLCRVADAALCLRPEGSSFSWPLAGCLEGLDTFRVLVESFRCVRRGAAPSAFLLGDDDDCRKMTMMTRLMMMMRGAFGKKNGKKNWHHLNVCGRDGMVVGKPTEMPHAMSSSRLNRSTVLRPADDDVLLFLWVVVVVVEVWESEWLL
jgi:hypothetical protein